tara:strand:- start:577 stop:1209 length:633 start_codon:yes stop_codon:yes gene_type:complete
MNLKNYVMRIPTLERGVCKKIITELDKQEWEDDHSLYSYNDVKDFNNEPIDNKEKTPSVDYTNFLTLRNSPTDNIIIEALYDAIKTYVTEKGGDYLKGWQGYTAIKYHKYGVGNFMAKHADLMYIIGDNNGEEELGMIDHPNKPFPGIPILSIIGVLNDDYEGGEVEMFEDTKFSLSAGEVLIFPSVFLYPHKVCEVLKGTRYSFVSWVY